MIDYLAVVAPFVPVTTMSTISVAMAVPIYTDAAALSQQPYVCVCVHLCALCAYLCVRMWACVCVVCVYLCVHVCHVCLCVHVCASCLSVCVHVCASCVCVHVVCI